MKYEKIESKADYLSSLRGRNLLIYLFGEKVEEPLDHPIIRPSINAMAETYALAEREPTLASVISPLTGGSISRFLHICENNDDLVQQNLMQRKLGQLTGTCFQRCVGMDALNALHSVTYEIDEAKKTSYHQRFLGFLQDMHRRNCVIGGAMTDVKGDRSRGPSDQADPDLFLHVTRRTGDGVFVSGAKAHQTGCINSHWLIIMPTMRLKAADGDYAIVGAVPVDAKGITYVYSRQASDTRSMESGDLDSGNALFGGQEAMIIFDEVFIPSTHIFLDGEYEFSAMLVERFTTYHRRSYVCKSGVGDALIGAAAEIAEMNGVANASHIKDKLVEMTHLNETIFGTGIASSHRGTKMKSGCQMCDAMLANVCKHHVTKMPFTLSRLAQDLAGGLVSTLPSQKDLDHPEIGPLLKKYLQGNPAISTEDRVRILRLIENITMGRNAVGYLTESIHGAGSPQAQRIQIRRLMDIEKKKQMARSLANTSSSDEVSD